MPKKTKKDHESDEASAESSGEELDLTKDCYPIAHYMDDRAEMINQMFSVIRGSKLRAMLPPILKNWDVEKLKLDCLDELIGMSEKRITSILEGEILDSSSESDVSAEESEESSGARTSNHRKDEKSGSRAKKKRHKRKSDPVSPERATKVSRVEEEEPAPEQGKTLLEILELEMRARAIRALLSQGGEPSEKETVGEIVDLTEPDEEEFPAIVKKEPEAMEQEKTFEDKVEKTAEKQKNMEEEIRKKKLLTELELRNRLIKKKSYRTRQQRLENVEEDLLKEPVEVENPVPELRIEQVRIKEEKDTEIVIEDPEDGEVSSEEEAPQPEVKKEKSPSPEPQEGTTPVLTGERISAMDDGNFVADTNVMDNPESGDDSSSVEEVAVQSKGVEDVVVEDEDAQHAGSELPANEGHEENSQTFDDILVDDSVSNVDSRPADDETSQTFDEFVVDSASNAESCQGDDENSQSLDDVEDTSWKGRWLKRNDVQNVVKSSKICAKVLKRMAKKKTRLRAVAEPEDKVEKPVVDVPVVVGSVEEYVTLMKRVKENRDLSEKGCDSSDTSQSNIVGANSENIGDKEVENTIPQSNIVAGSSGDSTNTEGEKITSQSNIIAENSRDIGRPDTGAGKTIPQSNIVAGSSEDSTNTAGEKTTSQSNIIAENSEDIGRPNTEEEETIPQSNIVPGSSEDSTGTNIEGEATTSQLNIVTADSEGIVRLNMEQEKTIPQSNIVAENLGEIASTEVVEKLNIGNSEESGNREEEKNTLLSNVVAGNSEEIVDTEEGNTVVEKACDSLDNNYS